MEWQADKKPISQSIFHCERDPNYYALLLSIVQ